LGPITGISVIRFDISTSQNTLDHLEHGLISVVLGHVKLWNHLPLPSRTRITLNRDMEATFSVNEPRHIVAKRFVWPSLLIGSTHRFVTSISQHQYITGSVGFMSLSSI
jgi:hypothetical protein